MDLELKNFVDIGMLKHLSTERRFFEDSSDERNIYWITGPIGNGTYELMYITRKGEKRRENLEPHLKDRYVGELNELCDELIKRMSR